MLTRIIRPKIAFSTSSVDYKINAGVLLDSYCTLKEDCT
jgi:hypothetical protein